MADLLPAVSWLNEAKCAGYLRVVRWNRLAYFKSNAGSRSVELTVTPDVPSFPYSFSSGLLVTLDSFLQVSLVFSAKRCWLCCGPFEMCTTVLCVVQ